MSFDIPGTTRSYQAAGDLRGSYLRFVKQAGITVTAISAITDKAVGVLQNKPAVAGAAAAVMTTGVTRVMAAKALAPGVSVYLDNVGRVTDVQGANAICVGETQTACSAADVPVSIELKPLAAVV